MKTKKALSLLLALCLAFALLAGCSNNTPAANSSAPGSSGSPSASASAPGASQPQGSPEVDMPAYKIGILSYTNSGDCWERILDAASYLAGELNCELMTAVGNTPDQIISETENFIAAGCAGIISLNDAGVTSRLVSLCDEAGVYLVFSDAGQLKDDNYADYAKNEHLVGHVSNDEYADAYAGAKAMIDSGAKNFVIFGLPPGIAPSFDQRVTGAVAAIKDAGLADPVEARSFALPEIANNLMSQYPDTDAIFSFVTTADSFNVPDMVANYGGKIQISSYMVNDATSEFESGFLTHACVGSEARIELAFALLYNALRGDRLANADGSAADILAQSLWITSADEFKTFHAATTGGNHAYTIDEIKQLIKVFNPDVTLDDYQAIADDFSDSSGWLASR